MATLPAEPQFCLPIVSSGLLRVTKEEWTSPADHFERLCDKALEVILAATATGSSSFREQQKRSILLFDCLLRVLDEPPISSPIAFSTTHFQSLQTLFYGALGSPKFIDNAETTRIAWAYCFYTTLRCLNESQPVLLADYRQKAAAPIPVDFVRAFLAAKLNEAEVRKLRPYLLRKH
ncbi:hypothetical protein [Rhodocyclus purpureus]|uniref:hypothetical protein n=1 Tax=Rhodocyclus purpureus TaxID=1067 RepID=UPI00191426A5|nr:hypothetical protein [Rhodocyclus purpureus]